jgi:response regulator RpfG family c-di-GMP phosphodiesterase
MKTILVVDDQPDARYSMLRPLERAGFDVRDTATGRDALRLAQLPVDAVVLDLVLTDMSGFDVLKRLKEPGTSPSSSRPRSTSVTQTGSGVWTLVQPPTSLSRSIPRRWSRLSVASSAVLRHRRDRRKYFAARPPFPTKMPASASSWGHSSSMLSLPSTDS